MKITHLCNNSRSSIGITQGLIALNHELFLKQDYISFGNLLYPKSNDIINNIHKSDIILIADSDGNDVLNFLDNVWHKTIHYDYRDACAILPEYSKSPFRFKRSITCGPQRKPIELNGINSIHHCALNEYYLFSNKKIYDVGCFFDESDPKHLGERRLNLIKTIKQANFANSLIGYSTGKKQEARLAISNTITNNCFYDFLQLQNKCKIIFTAQPTHCEGDNRTWEAMASGALVFMDKTYHKLEKPLIDGKHCHIFDANDIDSIKESINLAKWYLKNETQRQKLAEAGFNFTQKYHRPINRVNRILWLAGFTKTIL